MSPLISLHQLLSLISWTQAAAGVQVLTVDDAQFVFQRANKWTLLCQKSGVPRIFFLRLPQAFLVVFFCTVFFSYWRDGSVRMIRCNRNRMDLLLGQKLLQIGPGFLLLIVLISLNFDIPRIIDSIFILFL